MPTPPARYRTFRTPVGSFALIEAASGEISAAWLLAKDSAGGLPPGAHRDPDLLSDVSGRLARYFKGAAVEFDDIPTPHGAGFFRRCWDACRSIPRGETRTYGQLAGMADNDPGKARVAGQAMRRNPLPVVVPCHRVVAANGALHGYGGSRDPDGPELAIKRFLLEIEGAA